MRIYNKYIVLLALASCFIDSILAFFGQKDIGVYFVINIIAYLIITILYVHLNPRARMALHTIGFVLFGGFSIVVVLKVMEMLTQK